jgi:hypothetical protein
MTKAPILNNFPNGPVHDACELRSVFADKLDQTMRGLEEIAENEIQIDAQEQRSNEHYADVNVVQHEHASHAENKSFDKDLDLRVDVFVNFPHVVTHFEVNSRIRVLVKPLLVYVDQTFHRILVEFA